MPNPFFVLDPEKPLLTVKDVSELFKVPVKTIYDWTQRRLLPSIKLEKELRYSQQDLEAFVVQRMRKTSEQLTQEITLKKQELQKLSSTSNQTNA